MPAGRMAQRLFLPEQRLAAAEQVCRVVIELHTEKTSTYEVCPRYATPSEAVYDRPTVRVHDEPVRRQVVVWRIRTRRFSCKQCGRPDTEPVASVGKGARTTGGHGRVRLRGRDSIRKRYLIRTTGFDLSVLLRAVLGRGTPRGLAEACKDPSAAAFARWAESGAVITTTGNQRSPQRSLPQPPRWTVGHRPFAAISAGR